VFEAFVNPAVTTKFWFTKSSAGCSRKTIQWEWEMYGISIPVTAKAIEPNKRIVIDGRDTRRHHCEWTFERRNDGNTFVSITEAGSRAMGRDHEHGGRLEPGLFPRARGPEGAARA